VFRRAAAARERQFDVNVDFRPDSLDGLLLFADDDHLPHRGRFFAVALVKGRVHFR